MQSRATPSFFGAVTRHLLVAACACLGALGVTGAALSLAYEPSLRPALTENGESIALVEVLHPIKRKPPLSSFVAGEILLLPLEPPANRSFRVSRASDDTLRGAARILFDTVSGAPLIPTTAFYSVAREIDREMEFGWFVRGAHQAAASGAVLTLTLWLGFMLLGAGYRRYSTLGWACGLALWGAVFANAVIGSVLPMNLRSAAALEIMLAALQSTPLVGNILADAARGAPVVAAVTLVRLYAGHLLFLTAFVGICLYGLWRGLWRARANKPFFLSGAQDIEKKDDKAISIQRIDAAINVAATLWLCASSACVFSASAPLPPELALPASLAQIPPALATLSAEWYALGVVAYLRLAPAWSLSLVVGAFFASAMLLRAAEKRVPRFAAFVRGALLLVWTLAVALSVWEIFTAAAVQRAPHLWSLGVSERTAETFAVTTILTALLIGVLLLQRRFLERSAAAPSP